MGRLILVLSLLFVCLCGHVLGASSSSSESSVSTSVASSIRSTTSATATSTTDMSSSSTTSETQSSATSSATTSSPGSTTSSFSALPAITITNSNSLNDGSNTGTALPTILISTTASSTITYPTPIIPVTSNNPFSTTSNAPEGTVFIAVGSVIGGIALAVLGWRGLVAYSLHKSLKSSNAAYVSEPKGTSSGRGGFFSSKRQNSAGFYATGAGSSMSLDQLTSSGRAVNTARPISAYEDIGIPRNGPSFNTSTFYSPTAGAMGMSAPMANAVSGATTNRSSTYLPSGYYGVNHGAASSASLSARYSSVPQNQRAPSPGAFISTESSLAVPQHGQRVPTAYLDDLLDIDRS
ncbi:hypothetical protein V1525DRAFT_452754 [Lipomyces kononenkoae]|uniref:Uncharacterized protein n=1 Tax=Lipomyces kononenkoae TaxID=34357 RepID=A0ACC3SRP9_LIPKO